MLNIIFVHKMVSSFFLCAFLLLYSSYILLSFPQVFKIYHGCQPKHYQLVNHKDSCDFPWFSFVKYYHINFNDCLISGNANVSQLTANYFTTLYIVLNVLQLNCQIMQVAKMIFEQSYVDKCSLMTSNHFSTDIKIVYPYQKLLHHLQFLCYAYMTSYGLL